MKYTITCNEEQLWLIAHALEDWHRFLSGECELRYATGLIESLGEREKCRNVLNEQVRPLVVSDLGSDAPYPWNGDGCLNEEQRKAIAMSYGIYRQIRHFFADRRKVNWSVYKAPTLTCNDQGPLIKVEEVKKMP
jgi:hypothetical protein